MCAKSKFAVYLQRMTQAVGYGLLEVFQRAELYAQAKRQASFFLSFFLFLQGVFSFSLLSVKTWGGARENTTKKREKRNL